MPDKFATLEDPPSRARFFGVIALVLIGAFAVYRWSTSDFQPLHGVVEAVNAGKATDPQGAAPGKAAGTVMVRLADGTLVSADVLGVPALAVGEQVRLVMRPATDLQTPYEVVARLPVTPP